MLRLSFATLFVFMLAVSGYSQSPKDQLAAAEKFYSKKDYKKALDIYMELLSANPDDAAINLKIGLCYLYSDTKSKAAQYISKAYRLNPNINDDIDYHLGMAFQNTNEFVKAIEHFEAFKKKKKNLAEIADKKISECHIADSLSNYELNVIIENMGAGINTKQHDYSPIISSDGNTLIFTSNRSDDERAIKEGSNYEDIFISKKEGSAWSTPKKISTNINQKYNDAAASLSPDGKTLFLYYEEGAGDIYISTFDGSD